MNFVTQILYKYIKNLLQVEEGNYILCNAQSSICHFQIREGVFFSLPCFLDLFWKENLPCLLQIFST